MNHPNQGPLPGTDAVTRFWSDLASRMAAAGVTAPPASQEMMDQMRTGFFEVLSKHADDFMRSEQFLSAMKQSMDNALVLRKQVNDFLNRNLEAFQMPSSSDVEDVVQAIRSMENRITSRFDDLDSRLAALENGSNGSPRPKNRKVDSEPGGRHRSTTASDSEAGTKPKRGQKG